MVKTKKAKAKAHVVRVYNCSRQLIRLQVRPPGSDFFANEQQVNLMPRKHVTLPKSHLRWEQIENLQRRRIIQILYDSEAQEEKELEKRLQLQ